MKCNQLVFLLVSSITFSSCGDYSHAFHIDEERKAIIPCNGRYLKHVDIDGPQINITYEGVDTIYFNRPSNAVRITDYYNILDNDYVLKLEPNSSYNINSRPRNGDQESAIVEIKTDSAGNIIHDVNNANCQ